MLTLSNFLSLLRAPLALLFLPASQPLRVVVLVLAMMTDYLDGFVARRWGTVSRFGAVLDPVMDKLFVFFVLGVLIVDQQLEVWQCLAMISRDFSLCAYGIYLAFSGKWKTLRVKAIWWGKVTSMAQYLVLIAIVAGAAIPAFVFWAFIVLGVLYFGELLLMTRQYS
jgi:CDP-diacylglycerol---glycerol-3-phosphate 3-phosphatidyltransferase